MLRKGKPDTLGLLAGAYHAGDPYDDRTIATCKRNGIPIAGVSRKLRNSDFFDFDYIFGMECVKGEKTEGTPSNLWALA